MINGHPVGLYACRMSYAERFFDSLCIFQYRFMKTPEKAGSCSALDKERSVGMFKGEKFCADGYDIDENNDEIAEMFGVTK